MTDLHKRIEEVVNQNYDADGDAHAVEIAKEITTLFKEELEALAGEVKASKFPARLLSGSPNTPEKDYFNDGLEEAISIIRSKATQI